MVIGVRGQIGWELNRSLMPLGEVVALDRNACDLSSPQNLPDIVRSIRPDIIVNAAAYTGVDKAEQEEQLATTINGTAVGVLGEEARRWSALFIQFSTDYVFDGSKTDPYTEEDVPHPLNAYGRSKLAGEISLRQTGCDYVILRTSWVFAARGRNFVSRILQLANEQEELRVISDQVGAPTWARNLADATALIAKACSRKREENRFSAGIFHITASGSTSWCGFAEAILEDTINCATDSLQRRPLIRGIPSSDWLGPAARPKNSRLSNQKLAREFDIILPNWRAALSLCLKELAP
jgi:dTDP-4-dehydrorhamnose reductase